MASSWILFFSYQDDARSNAHQTSNQHRLPYVYVHTSYELRYANALFYVHHVHAGTLT